MEPRVNSVSQLSEDSWGVHEVVELPEVQEDRERDQPYWPPVKLHLTGVIRRQEGMPEDVAVLNVRSEWPSEFIGTGPNMNTESVAVVYGQNLRPATIVDYFRENWEGWTD